MKEVEVKAKIDTKMGISKVFVPKGTRGVGHIYTSSHNKKRYWAVKWQGKYGLGQHALEDITRI